MDTKKKKEKEEREPNRVKVLHQIGFSSYTFVVKGVWPLLPRLRHHGRGGGQSVRVRC